MNKKNPDEFPNVGAPAFRALDSIGITELAQLTKFNEKDLLSLHGFGPKALKLLREALAKKGMVFAKK